MMRLRVGDRNVSLLHVSLAMAVVSCAIQYLCFTTLSRYQHHLPSMMIKQSSECLTIDSPETLDEEKNYYYDNWEEFYDIEFIRMVGAGDVSMGFLARYQGELVIAKVTSDSNIFYSDMEAEIFERLNRPPTISNIPELKLAIRSMPNPFTNVTYLVRDLLIPATNAVRIVQDFRISVLVLDFVKDQHQPTSIKEVRTLIKSLLSALNFAHSRNVIHADLHPYNYFFDGKQVFLHDWNGAVVYHQNPDAPLRIHMKGLAEHLYPPEAWFDETATHASVSAFDVYAVGLNLVYMLMDCCNIPFEWDDGDFGDTYESEESLALDLADKMMTIDPYHRPNTTELLKHPFFTKRSQRKKEEIKEHFPAIEYYFATRGKILFNKALPVAEEG